MNHGRKISARARTVLGGFGLLVLACASAQAPQASQPRTVPLVSDTCPSVRVGDSISLDWNPDFDPIWPVTGLRDFYLTFAGVADDGVHLARRELDLDMRHAPTRISALGNGFFHIEFTVDGRSISPGIYRLVRANANAEVVQDYAGGPPRMTLSPVDGRYCITVVGPQAPQPPPPGSQ